MINKIAYTAKDIITVIIAATSLIEAEDFKLLIREDSNLEAEKTTKLLFSLRDEAEGNLGNIEDDTFNTLADVLDRMDIYHNDYVYGEYKEQIKSGAKLDANTDCLQNVIFLNSDFCADLLRKITPKVYMDFQPRLEMFRREEAVRHLIDKNIVMKIFENLTAKKIAEHDGVIYVSAYNTPFDSNEEFLNAVLNEIEFKEFKDFFQFSSYGEIIESERQQILDDIQDLGLYDENGYWNFYLTPEELRYLGIPIED